MKPSHQLLLLVAFILALLFWPLAEPQYDLTDIEVCAAENCLD